MGDIFKINKTMEILKNEPVYTGVDKELENILDAFTQTSDNVEMAAAVAKSELLIMLHNAYTLGRHDEHLKDNV